MELLSGALPWIQIILAIILVIAIILQQNAAGIGGAFGGGDGGAINRTRRGAERTLFQVTIVVGILFALSVLASFFGPQSAQAPSITASSTATTTISVATSSPAAQK